MGALKVTILNASGELGNLKPAHVEVFREVNRIPAAELTLWDGDFAKQDFEQSNLAELEPGQELSFRMEYLDSGSQQGGKNVPPIFKGIIIKQTVEAGAARGSSLVIELKSKAYLMTLRRRSRVFRDMKDSEVFQAILSDYGMQTGQIEDTINKHPELVQYNCTDWDFLLSRVDFNGLWLNLAIDNNGIETVDIVNPVVAATPDFTLTVGLSNPPIYALEMEADISNQCGTVESLSWNSHAQQMTRIVKANDYALAHGNLDPTAMSAAIGSDSVTLRSPAGTTEDDLQTWADAFLRKSRLSMLRGQLSVKGEYTYQLNKTIEIKGGGKRFNGRTLISGVRQVAGTKGWTTHLQFGQPANWFTAQPDVPGQPASAMLPPINGLHIGKVEAYENDQEHRLLVKVSVPAIHEKEGLVYARLAMPYAGNGHGFFFRPEVGDEVVLGFFDNDPGMAVVLGSLYSGANMPPLDTKQIETNNDTKAWASRQGIQMIWDEKTPSLQFMTHEQGGKKTGLLLEKDKAEFSDVNGNIITLDKQGITIQSDKAVTIVAPKVDVN